MRRFRAVVFDFDGTLADTMGDHFRAWQAVMAEYGIRLLPEDYYPLEGVRVAELPRRFFARYRQAARDEEAIVRKKEQHYLAHHRFAFYPSVEGFIRELREKAIPMAVVTTGLRQRLRDSVPAGFLEQFEAVVTGDDTVEGKPSPQPYLRGAEKLGVSSAECIVVENAPLGIEAAKRAGAYCIALCTTVPRPFLEQAGADEVVESFEALGDSAGIRRLLEAVDGVAPRRGR
jgi:beta-phosphoglucomutase